MKCKVCSKETSNEYEVCEECEKTLTLAINKNRVKMVKTKIANQNRGITSLVCSIIALAQPFGLLTAFICGIVSIVFGSAAKNTAGEQIGKVGKTIGIVSLTSCVISAIINFFMIAVGIGTVVFVIIIGVTLGQMGLI